MLSSALALVTACDSSGSGSPGAQSGSTTGPAGSSGNDETAGMTSGDAESSTGGSTNGVTTMAATSATTMQDESSTSSSTTAGDEESSTGSLEPTVGRIIWFVSPHGVSTSNFMPEIVPGEGPQFETSAYLEPLVALEDFGVTLVTGIENVAPQGPSSNVSNRAAATLLTGSAVMPTGDGFSDNVPLGPSIDTVLADLHTPAAPRLVFNPVPQVASFGRYVSFTQAGDPIEPLTDPVEMIDAFGLDVDVDPYDVFAPGAIPATSRITTEIIARLFATSTDYRFATLYTGSSEPNFPLPKVFEGGNFTVNDAMHSSPDDALGQSRVTAFWRWQAEVVFGLAVELAQTEDGDRTLLDSTLIVWTSPYGGPAPAYHSSTDLPVVVIGGAALGNPGGVIDGSGFNQADLAMSIAARAGYPLATFGDPSLAAEPIPGL
ncbi:MAG: DUF1552 domain-containing protein [Myxococcota bacterium]